MLFFHKREISSNRLIKIKKWSHKFYVVDSMIVYWYKKRGLTNSISYSGVPIAKLRQFESNDKGCDVARQCPHAYCYATENVFQKHKFEISIHLYQHHSDYYQSVGAVKQLLIVNSKFAVQTKINNNSREHWKASKQS